MSELQRLLLNLYHHMRDPRGAGMALTIEQFDLLCAAIDESELIVDWEQLKTICRVVWVKPHEDFSLERFESGFEQYRQQCLQVVQDFFQQAEEHDELDSSVALKMSLGELPSIPPRDSSSNTLSSKDRVQSDEKLPPSLISAMKGEVNDIHEFLLQELPISLSDVRQIWGSLGRLPLDLPELELDMDATLEQYQRTGALVEVLTRASRRYAPELILLIDQDTSMVPFGPVIQPFIQVVQENWIRPAQAYRYTTVPTQYFYDWDRPSKAVPILELLSQMNRFKTIVIVISDAGAASQTFSQSRFNLTGKFLERLRPCVRDFFWINPMPPETWHRTTAESLAKVLGGIMLQMDALALKQAMLGCELTSEVLQWSLIP